MIETKKLAVVKDLITSGGIGVIPTDTIYGIVGSALSEAVVERIYRVRKRDLEKPFIVLIASLKDLERFGVAPDASLERFLKKYWPGAVSIVLPILSKRFEYLHRGKGSIAFRLPAKKDLQKFLQETGPLVAPSANPGGQPPAKDIADAKRYFGERVDFYVDQGIGEGEASTLVVYRSGAIEVLRQGSVAIDLE